MMSTRWDTRWPSWTTKLGWTTVHKWVWHYQQHHKGSGRCVGHWQGGYLLNQGVRGKVESSGCNLQGDSLSFSSRSQSKVSRFAMVNGAIVPRSPSPPQFLFLWQGVLADKVILGNLGPGLITQDLVVFQVKQQWYPWGSLSQYNILLISKCL